MAVNSELKDKQKGESVKYKDKLKDQELESLKGEYLDKIALINKLNCEIADQDNQIRSILEKSLNSKETQSTQGANAFKKNRPSKISSTSMSQDKSSIVTSLKISISNAKRKHTKEKSDLENKYSKELEEELIKLEKGFITKMNHHNDIAEQKTKDLQERIKTLKEKLHSGDYISRQSHEKELKRARDEIDLAKPLDDGDNWMENYNSEELKEFITTLDGNHIKVNKGSKIKRELSKNQMNILADLTDSSIESLGAIENDSLYVKKVNALKMDCNQFFEKKNKLKI